MISTPTGIFFDGYSYDPDESCTPPVLDETVVLAATNDAFSVSFKHSVETWLDTLWWFSIEFPRKRIPEEFDFLETDLQTWLDLFTSEAALVNPNHVPSHRFEMPLPRKGTPTDRYQDWMYFVFSWVSYRRDITLLLPTLSEGSSHISFGLVASLEVPLPTTIKPGRVFHIGVLLGHESEAMPWKKLNTPVDV